MIPEYICDRCWRPRRTGTPAARFDGTCTCRAPWTTGCSCRMCRHVGKRVRTAQMVQARIYEAMRTAA